MIVFNDNAEQTSLAVITCCRWSWLRSYLYTSHTLTT